MYWERLGKLAVVAGQGGGRGSRGGILGQSKQPVEEEEKVWQEIKLFHENVYISIVGDFACFISYLSVSAKTKKNILMKKTFPFFHPYHHLSSFKRL